MNGELVLLSRSYGIILCYMKIIGLFFDTFELDPLNHVPCGEKDKKEKWSIEKLPFSLGSTGG